MLENSVIEMHDIWIQWNLPFKMHNVFIIVGAYYGITKPNNCNAFLEDFVNDLIELIHLGGL